MRTGIAVEQDWMTTAGYRAVVLFVRESYRYGYVRVFPEYPLYGVNYDEKSPVLGSLKDNEEIGKKDIMPGVIFDVPGCSGLITTM